MAPDRDLAFEFMRVNYEFGLIDEMGSIVGEALEAVMLEKGMDMEDVINLLDGTGEDTVERINSVIDRRADLALKLAANRSMTRLQARLLKFAWARRGAVRAATWMLRRSINPTTQAAEATFAASGRCAVTGAPADAAIEEAEL